jgi:hypothetical protein
LLTAVTEITPPTDVLFNESHLFLNVVAAGSAGARATAVVEIPFDFVRNEIILQIKIDGKGPFNMMLDTH